MQKSTIPEAVAIAVLFLPAHFLNEMLSYRLFSVSMYVVLILVGFAACLAAYSSTWKAALVKWLLSVPVTVVFWHCQIQMQFSLRGLNWTYPGYGTPSAGGNFSGFGLLCTLAGALLTGLAAGTALSRKETMPKWFLILKYSLVPALCAGILISIAVLHSIMPPYHPVYG